MDTQVVQLKKKDFETQNDVRWCPGCGDYSILAAVQKLLPQLSIPKEKFLFVSGIGCSSRFPYYLNTYGFHTIHGRAPSVATGAKLANPDLSVWLITGDGDSLSIGGNHFIHLIRRNVNVNVLLFNNQIYGLTKGQYSPTSELGKITKSSPVGSTDQPLSPASISLGSGSTFFARALDVDPKGLHDVLLEAHNHEGTSIVEIFQNCVIFNDKAFDHISDKKKRKDNQLVLKDGEYLTFGAEGDKGLRLNMDSLSLEVVEDVKGREQELGIMKFDKSNRTQAHLLSRINWPDFPVPIGVMYQNESPTFDTDTLSQVSDVPSENVDSILNDLYTSGQTWSVS